MNGLTNNVWLTYLFFLIVVLVLVNIYPYMGFEPSSEYDLVLYLVSTVAVSLAYLFVKYIYLSLSLNKQLRTISMRDIYRVASSLKILLLLLSLLLSVSVASPVLIALYSRGYAPENSLLALLYGYGMYIASLIIEYILAPYIIVSRVFGRKHGFTYSFILFGLPWFIIFFTVSTIVNTTIAALMGLEYVFPYYRGWSSGNLKLLYDAGPGSVFLPSYGGLLAVLFTALYNRGVAWKYV